MSRISILLSIILLSACCTKKTTSQKDTTKSSQKTALIGSWQVENIGKNKSAKKLPTLTFEKDKIYGNAGCNNYNADVNIKGNEISFGFFIRTKMYCNNMKTEKAFIAKLEKAKSYKIIDEKLKLYTEGGDELLSFKATK